MDRSRNKGTENKYKRSRRSSPYRNQSKRHRSRSRSPQYTPKAKKIEDYKHELQRFLEERASIKETREFWTFYQKYLNIQKLKPKDPSLNRHHLLNIDFDDSTDILWDRLPVLDKFGQKFIITREDFEEFLLVIRVYQDFQQKSKFTKLKKLRQSQADLPIANYKKDIIDKLKDNRVVLIAGNTGKILKPYIDTVTKHLLLRLWQIHPSPSICHGGRL